MNREFLKKYFTRPEKFIDDSAKKVINQIEKAPPVKKIRGSQIITAIVGVTGFALVIDGISKAFVTVPGWATILIGISFLAVSGALLKFIGENANWW